MDCFMVIYDTCSICGTTTMCVSVSTSEDIDEIYICHNCVSDMAEALRDIDISEVDPKDEEEDEYE